MRRLFRWAFRLALALVVLAIVCAAAAILLADTLARELLIRRLRAATGMEAKVAEVHIGILSPTMSIEGLKLYNSADFGGSLCLDMPEVHLEYDPSALRSRKLHLTLLRFDLKELSIMQDKQGRKNFEAPRRNGQPSTQRRTSPGARWKFVSIDVLNASLGKFRMTSQASGRGEEIDFSVKNQILRNVKSWDDLAPLGLSALSRGQASSTGESSVDLSAMVDSLLKAP
ncbi:MAG TPA: hypothetical protein VGO59_14470 [Verrucomicrobiae bacterium]|jgi:uncharacterized protein involved in outer membrane biogenesis